MPEARILIVEDEAIEAMDIQQSLVSFGYPLPDIAYTGEEGIRKAEQTQPDLILMDIMMPEKIDGVAAAEQIRSRFDIPIIFLTAYSDENTLRRAKITAPYGYILKPFQERELHITVDMALYRHKIEKELREKKKWLEITLRSIGDGVIATDEKGLITFINPVAERLMGCRLEEVLQRNLTEVFNIVNRDTREVVENPVTKVILDGNTAGLANHTVLISRDGKEIPISDSAAPIRDDNGKILGVVLVFSDITEREKFEEALDKAYNELEARIEERTKELKEAERAVREINATLEQRVAERTPELQTANVSLLNSRRAALNLMEDALDARKQAEESKAELLREVVQHKQTAEALRESEERVRLKLESILLPEGDIGNLELGDIIDAPAIQSLVDNLYRFVQLPVGILDLKGKVLVSAGWQDICTKFHRVHPDTCRHCSESDLELTRSVPAGEFRLYKCKNGMWDAVTPVIVGGQHMGNLFWGQFFFEDEPLDREFFRAQALKYGFNEEEYLAALEGVPRISREALDSGMAFYLKLSDMLSKLSYSNIKLARSLSERDTLLHSLRESEVRLNRSQEIAHLGSWELDLADNSLAWSDEVYRIFGLQPQEFAATYEAFLEAVHPDDRAAVAAAYSGSLREGRDTYEIEHRVVRKVNGEIRYVREKCRHFRDETGRIVRSAGMVHDITDRKQAEREREITVEFLHLVNSSAGTEDLIRAAASFFREQSGCEALGIRLKKGDDFPYYEARGFSQEFVLAENSLCARDTAGDVIRDTAGNPVLACMCGDIICGRFDPVKGFFTKGGSFWTNDMTELMADTVDIDRQIRAPNRCHDEGYESVALIPLRAGQEQLGLVQLNDRRKGMFSPEAIALWERLAGYLSIALMKFRAEEEINKLNEELELKVSELEDANRELESFIYSVSHDLRAPLRSISAFVSFMTRDRSDQFDDRSKNYLMRITQGTAKMSRLIEDLLDLSKISRQGVVREEIDLSKLALAIVSDLRETDPGRSVVFRIMDCEMQIAECENRFIVYADPRLIEIAFSNLLGNSWKFTSKIENARIEFGAIEYGLQNTEYGTRQLRLEKDPRFRNPKSKTERSKIVYYVRDNGAGFDPEYAEKMFLPFHRLHSEDEFEGTGIGLAIVERVIRRHGGRIWAKGEPGKGATVYFTLG